MDKGIDLIFYHNGKYLLPKYLRIKYIHILNVYGNPID